mmetsp:Transcript_30906/g.59654  ORF Transcript_30906/g.59654 Transcript_30906/m.59654 type:complete len:230 (+) Transcript_30906:3560-4249(+)
MSKCGPSGRFSRDLGNDFRESIFRGDPAMSASKRRECNFKQPLARVLFFRYCRATLRFCHRSSHGGRRLRGRTHTFKVGGGDVELICCAWQKVLHQHPHFLGRCIHRVAEVAEECKLFMRLLLSADDVQLDWETIVVMIPRPGHQYGGGAFRNTGWPRRGSRRSYVLAGSKQHCFPAADTSLQFRKVVDNQFLLLQLLGDVQLVLLLQLHNMCSMSRSCCASSVAPALL